MKACEASVLPVFNRCVIFNTDAELYHGHPLPMTCPEGTFRRSIALYYYTVEENPYRRATYYQARPGDGSNKLLVKVDNALLSAYTALKGKLGANDKLVSRMLRFFPEEKVEALARGRPTGARGDYSLRKLFTGLARADRIAWRADRRKSDPDGRAARH